MQGKLVRDKIPQIIAADGKKPITRILEQEEYLLELDKKLNEEMEREKLLSQTTMFVQLEAVEIMRLLLQKH